MTMKPPSGLAAESDSDQDLDGEDLSDEVMVDNSDDVTVEAAEEVTTESITRAHPEPDATPPPLSALADSALGGARPLPPSLIGVFSPSLPLPGVTAVREPERGIDDDVTTLAHGINEDVTRPAITDDDEEETKVEPAETAIHAAASRDDVATALSEQASFEREKALRKSVPPSSYVADTRARARDDVEFADPEDDGAVISSADAISSVDAISADPISADPVSADPIDDDDDGIEVGGRAAAHPANDDDDADDDATAMFGKSTQPSPLVAALTARRPGSPPTGSPFGRDAFGSARLPAPSGGFGGLSLSSPAQAPAPASSPFGRLAPAPAGSPYGARATASALPALQIPAPSGAAATSGSPGLLRRVQLPIFGLGVVVVGALFVGFVVGYVAHGPGAPAPIPVPAARPAMPAIAAPEVQPVPPPTPGATPTPIPAATTPPEQPSAVAKKSGGDLPVGEEAGTQLPGTTGTGTAGLGEPPVAPAKPIKHVVKPRKPPAVLGDEPAAPKPAAKPAAVKPAKPAKPSKAWVDPFAQ